VIPTLAILARFRRRTPSVPDCIDTGRWFLGLYGGEGRELQIDCASKTGRAEVTAFVMHSEGIEETR
jgi:hypothetical protein